jgi:hypothetical protein
MSSYLRRTIEIVRSYLRIGALVPSGGAGLVSLLLALNLILGILPVMADLIIVVADGKVVEAGPHAALLRNRGLYSELYQLQASAYE